MGKLPKIVTYLPNLAENSGHYKRIGICASETINLAFIKEINKINILDKP